MKRLIAIFVLGLLLAACGGAEDEDQQPISGLVLAE